MNPRRRLLIRGCLVFLAAAGVAVVLYFVSLYPPTDASFYPKCSFHSLTGLHCPGCGLSRSVHSLLNGQFLQALAYNVLAVLFLPYLAYHGLRLVWSFLWGPQPARSPDAVPSRALPTWFIWAIFALFVGFGIARNIPVYPFTLLAPHQLGQ